jgi:hypothetical protein
MLMLPAVTGGDMKRRSIVLVIASSVVGIGSGCGRDMGPSLSSPSFNQEPCAVTPALCDPVDGTIHDRTGDGALYEPPGDPSPGALGVWLGSQVAPRWCYADQNLLILDTDKDWLADECEFELARAFAPAMALEGSCDGGEPYWAAKYFPTVSRVRIVYLPAYYFDCGDSPIPPLFNYDHYGDSEPIRYDVRYNAATHHWELAEPEVFLLAHNDNSYWASIGLEYPVRQLAYPRIWVAENKHAHYQSRAMCNSGGHFGGEDCSQNTVRGRLLVYKGRNIGSRHVDLFIDGVKTQDPRHQNYPRREYFYQEHLFGGWGIGATDANSTTPFSQHLLSGIFEIKTIELPCGLNCLGPGPNPPSSAVLLGTIDGPTLVTAYQTYTWNSMVTGGNSPYHAEWWRTYPGQSAVLWGTSSQTGNFNAGSWTAYLERCGNFTLTLKTFSTDAQVATQNFPVGVTCPPSVTIQGPTIITIKGTYTYSAVTTAMGPATFTWSWRNCNDAAGTSCSPWQTATMQTLGRTLSPDCSGTGEKNFQVKVSARDNFGLSATDDHVTWLCSGALK